MKFFEDLAVGDVFESPNPYHVTADDITSYAAQWDPMPYHLDEAEAQKTVVGQLFAPAMFTLSLSTKLTHDTKYYELSTMAGLGIDEVRMPKPVLVADQLKVKVTVVSMRESQSKPGLGVITTKNEMLNQNGEVVLSYLLSGLVNKRTP